MNHNIQSTYVESLKLRCKHWHDLYLDKLGALFAGGPSVTKDKRLSLFRNEKPFEGGNLLSIQIQLNMFA